MYSLFSLHELSIVLLIRNHNHTLLNWDFLKCTGIVPQDWQLASEPISTQNFSQIAFQNGLRIVADNSKIIFTETIGEKSLVDIVVAQIAKFYTQILPYAEYQALGLNPEAFVTFPEHPEIAQNYLSKTLFFSQPWLEFGNTTPRVDLNISYTLDQGTLNLKVAQQFIKQEDGETMTPIVVYSGNFEYMFEQFLPAERSAILWNYLEQWQLNVETFNHLIKNQFLQGLNTPLSGVDTDTLMGLPMEMLMQ
ncbi:MAG TPA: hypothetical protein V6D25_04440 [Leptolyngbyaceae cyanobacterium]